MANLFKKWKDMKLRLGVLFFFFGCVLLFCFYIGYLCCKHPHQVPGHEIEKEKPKPNQTINNHTPQITKDDHKSVIPALPGRLLMKKIKPPIPDKNAGIPVVLIHGSVSINATGIHSPGNVMMESTIPTLGHDMEKEDPQPQTINNHNPQITKDDHKFVFPASPGGLLLKAIKPPIPKKNAGIPVVLINGSASINATGIHSQRHSQRAFTLMESTIPTLDVYFVNHHMDVGAASRQRRTASRIRRRRAIYNPASKAKAQLSDSEKL